MHALDELNSKINALIKKYTAIEAENKRFRELIAKHEATEASLKKQLASLEQDMVSVDLGGTVGDKKEKENMRKQLDTLIGEIDVILNTLND